MEPAADELLWVEHTAVIQRVWGRNWYDAEKPEDLGSEDQRGVELAGCSGKEDFFYHFLFWVTKNQFLDKDFYGEGWKQVKCYV